MKRHLLMMLAAAVTLSILISSLIIWPSIEKGFLAKIEQTHRQTRMHREANTEQIQSWRSPMFERAHHTPDGRSIQNAEAIY